MSLSRPRSVCEGSHTTHLVVADEVRGRIVDDDVRKALKVHTRTEPITMNGGHTFLISTGWHVLMRHGGALLSVCVCTKWEMSR